jgi:hypothetical protein
VLWSGENGALNQHLFKVTSEKFPKWFYYFWIHQHLPDFRHIAAGKATTMGHIQRHHLTEALVVVPSSQVLAAADRQIAPLVDWSQDLIFVRRSLFWRTTKEAGGGTSRWVYQSPKSEKSKRTIPVSPILRRSLETHRLNTIQQANPDNLIFARPDGRPLEPDLMVRRQFLPALTRAGLRQIHFHDLRHTAASLLIAQGEHPKTVQTILGHASSRTTFDVYGHLYHATLQAVGPKLDSQVFGAAPSQAPIHSVAPGDLLKVGGQ